MIGTDIAIYNNINIYLYNILLNKDNYKKYREYIYKNNLNEIEIIILNIIDYIFKNNKDINNINKELFISIFNTNYSNIKDKDIILNVIDNIFNIKDNIESKNLIILSLIKKYYLQNIIEKCIDIQNNLSNKDLDIIENILNDYKIKSLSLKNDSIQLISNDLDSILKKESDVTGYNWFVPELNDVLGTIKGGDMGLVVAVPETGKTAFVLSVATSILQQAGKVLHINNEERGSKVMLRAIMNLTKMTRQEILLNKEKVKEKIDVYMKDKYFLYDLVGVSILEIKRLIEKHNPDLLIIDQAWKIKVKQQDRNDLTLTSIYKELREIAKNFNVHVLGVSQADSNAYTKKYLTLENIFGSKIGVQGEMDYIIGISKDEEEDKADWRYLSFPKNKLTGSNNVKVVLKLDKERSLYYS